MKQGRVEIDMRTKSKWVMCPYCNKKAIQIMPTTIIRNLEYMCKGSGCKQKFMIDVDYK